MPARALASYSTRALEAELRRRREEAGAHPRHQCIIHPFTPCDECQHFKPWKHPTQEIPSDYNPCSKGHVMKFRCPKGSDIHAPWGFYRHKCRDRLPLPKTEH